MKFRIAQCLCPQRHCMLAMGAQTPEESDANVIALLRTAIAAVLDGLGAEIGLPERMNPFCGLCGAPASSWTYEVAWSKPFESWEQAKAHLAQQQTEQQLSKLLMDALGVSHDVKRVRNN